MFNSTLDDLGKKYEIENIGFLEYLTRTNTVESLQELDSQRTSLEKGKLSRIRDSRMNALHKSGSSASSSVNSVLFKKPVESEGTVD